MRSEAVNGNAIYGAIDPSTGSAMTYTYDVENRIVSAGSNGGSYNAYGYDPQGKRVMRQTLLSGGPNSPFTGTYSSEFTFYGVTGQRLSTFTVTSSNYNNSGYCNGYNYCTSGPYTGILYFGGRLLAVTDRLGSARGAISYYPWGEEKTSPLTQDGQVKFATYFRDMPGQDYADQRYYTATAGRFYTPDPSTGVDLKNPITWNKYVYASDDPVNRYDPSGLFDCPAGATCITVTGTTDPVGLLAEGPSSTPSGLYSYGQAMQAAQVDLRIATQILTHSTQLRTLAAGKLALLALQNNPDCAALFGGQLVRDESGIPSPSAVLAGILNGTGYGTIQYANIPGTSVAGGTEYTNATTVGVAQYTTLGNGTKVFAGFGSATITINTAPSAPYNTDSLVDNAVTLLHELGHVFGDLYGYGSTAIQDDSSSSAISLANTQLVKSNCFP